MTTIWRTPALRAVAAVVFAALMLSGGVLAGQVIRLPEPAKTVGMDLFAALQQRKSVRSFDKSRPVDQRLLSTLLWAAMGINRDDGKRTTPFSHGNVMLDLYVLQRDGCYFFDAEKNTLVKVSDRDIRNLAYKQEEFYGTPLSLLFVYDSSRLPGYADAESEYQGAHASLGAAMQNVYLTATPLGLGTVAVVSIHAEKLKAALDLKATEWAVMAMPIAFLK